MGPDMELRASTAIGALEALTLLIDNQAPGAALSTEDVSPLLHCVFDAVKKAVPTYRPLGGINDDEAMA